MAALTEEETLCAAIKKLMEMKGLLDKEQSSKEFRAFQIKMRGKHAAMFTGNFLGLLGERQYVGVMWKMTM